MFVVGFVVFGFLIGLIRHLAYQDGFRHGREIGKIESMVDVLALAQSKTEQRRREP